MRELIVLLPTIRDAVSVSLGKLRVTADRRDRWTFGQTRAASDPIATRSWS
jgi:hypothetical protein